MLFQIVDAVAGKGRNHEDIGKDACFVQSFCLGQKLGRGNRVDFV